MNTVFIPQVEDFQTEINGKKTTLLSLKNNAGMEVFITNYGARIVGILVPDRHGNLLDVNIGHASIQEYTCQKANYYGAVIARNCGRIRDAKFTLDGKEFLMKPNNGATFLHGGENAFHTQVYEIESQTPTSVMLSYFSKDGEEGFPGNLTFKVYYTLTEENALEIKFEAVADQKTPFNVTHHAYFNLDGEGNGDILNQELQVFTEEYLQIKEDILPTGVFVPVVDTPFDFRNSKKIGKDIDAEDEQIQYGSGYDHTFVLSRVFDGKIRHAAKAKSEASGVVMDVYTDQPGVHLYTGNFMEEEFTLKNKEKDKRRAAFCLETQHLADALNKPNFPSIILSPKEKFTTTTIYKFSVE
ncbi:aldose epimerase family protein [Elizabethkingia sp. JS20170427COW]|uniref:aldose epimerase family protein n=1 Tax=Elizabethkingia sp. JS20170427COW TaxID=2583851 RepID=UPI0011104115|nr:aldose epimerase family protein [Elizabethkingia sp. JS20170427COW]QCX53727.1 galactose mutarotase [Elizabethkingia sp. JS20170427COW]